LLGDDIQKCLAVDQPCEGIAPGCAETLDLLVCPARRIRRGQRACRKLALMEQECRDRQPGKDWRQRRCPQPRRGHGLQDGQTG
jgi:hypothetical protein